MMSENGADNPHQQWSRFWQSASGFWRGLPAWRAWLLCASLVFVVVLQLYVQFRLIAVIVVAGDIAGVAVLDAALLPAIAVPDAIAATLDVRRAFDLKIRGRHAPQKVALRRRRLMSLQAIVQAVLGRHRHLPVVPIGFGSGSLAALDCRLPAPNL
jgi:hypothetical protein